MAAMLGDEEYSEILELRTAIRCFRNGAVNRRPTPPLRRRIICFPSRSASGTMIGA